MTLMVEWQTVKIPRELIEKIDKFTNSKIAKEVGYTSRSQAVITALRDFLLKWKGEVTFYLKSPRYGKLEFKKDGPIIFCVKCRSQICDHAVLLFKHKRLFDFDLMENGDVLSGVDFDKIPDVRRPQKS